MTEEQLYKAAHKMREQGGSFAAAIANAYFFADKDNTERLLKAFMHLFERFAPTEENAHE
jgi:predicted oxidoreductase (fatty acid repression mutant protein)